MIDRLLNLDRRIVYVVVFVSVTLALLIDFRLPVRATPNVLAVYNGVERLEEGSSILISFDFGPSTVTELGPMARAVLHHCFRKKLRVIAVTLVPDGQGITQRFLEEGALEFGAEYGQVPGRVRRFDGPAASHRSPRWRVAAFGWDGAALASRSHVDGDQGRDR